MNYCYGLHPGLDGEHQTSLDDLMDGVRRALDLARSDWDLWLSLEEFGEFLLQPHETAAWLGMCDFAAVGNG